MRYMRSFALAIALAFLVIPAAPLGGIVPIPTVGGDALANGECRQFDEASGYWCPPPDEYGTPAPIDLNDAICPGLEGILQGALASLAAAERMKGRAGRMARQVAAGAVAAAEAGLALAGC